MEKSQSTKFSWSLSAKSAENEIRRTYLPTEFQKISKFVPSGSRFCRDVKNATVHEHGSLCG